MIAALFNGLFWFLGLFKKDSAERLGQVETRAEDQAREITLLKEQNDELQHVQTAHDALRDGKF